MTHEEILIKIKKFLQKFLKSECQVYIIKQKEKGLSLKEIEIKFVSLFHSMKIIACEYENYSAWWLWQLKIDDKDFVIELLKEHFTID